MILCFCFEITAIPAWRTRRGNNRCSCNVQLSRGYERMDCFMKPRQNVFNLTFSFLFSLFSFLSSLFTGKSRGRKRREEKREERREKSEEYKKKKPLTRLFLFGGGGGSRTPELVCKNGLNKPFLDLLAF